MRIGVPTEIKTREYRVGAQPAGVRQLVAAGHQVFVQKGAGLGSGFDDAAYEKAGATIVPDAAAAWEQDMIIKVKEPLPAEFEFFRPGQIIYTYLHLAAVPELTHKMLEKEVLGVAYETVTDDDGGLPLLRPMSEIAGRMAIQVGAASLERSQGGLGILLGGVPGTRRGRVTVLGGGVVGTAAARIALGMGAHVTVLDISGSRMAELEDIFGNGIETLYSNPETVEEQIERADLVVGAVLIPGGAAPRLIAQSQLKTMQKGAVIVDVAVDQGGCIESCRPTTHDEPTFVVDDVVHYCVANMPGAVPRSSTYALTNATIGYALKIANQGLESAIRSDIHLARGVNTYKGHCTVDGVAKAHAIPYKALDSLL